MNPNTLSPYVRCAMHSQLRAPFKLGQRIIFDYEIIYLAEGRFLFTMDGNSIADSDFPVSVNIHEPFTLQYYDIKCTISKQYPVLTNSFNNSCYSQVGNKNYEEETETEP